MRRKVSIIGSHGYKAKYGGWDQLVNNLIEGLDVLDFIVYNSKQFKFQERMPHGHIVVNVPLRAEGLSGMFFDLYSVIHCWKKVDTLLLLGNQIMPIVWFLNLFVSKKKRVVVNPGGIEWERSKYNALAKLYLRLCMKLSSNGADAIIFDNKHFVSLLKNDFKRYAVIPYGASINKDYNCRDFLSNLGLLPEEYYVSVSRSIVDNQIVELLENWPKENRKLVLVSNLSASDYGKSILKRFSNHDNIVLINGLYDKNKLDYLRRSARAYIHTHAKCGTAPSLVEAILCGLPIFSFDVPQNRYTLKNHGYFFSDFGLFQNIESLLESARIDKAILEGELSYPWEATITEYFQILDNKKSAR